MHEESSYEGLDLIECEVRRRTFWLLFGGMTQKPLISSFTILNVVSSGQINVYPPGEAHLL